MWFKWVVLLAVTVSQDAASERYRQAEAAKETARIALERSYNRFEDAVLRLRVQEPQTKPALLQALLLQLEALQPEIDVLQSQVDAADPVAVSRHRRETQLRIRNAFLALLDRRVDAPELNRLVAEQLARTARSRLGHADLEVRLKSDLLDDLLYQPLEFH